MRSISYDGKNSYTDFGLTIDDELTVIGDAEPHFYEETVPYRNGTVAGFTEYGDRIMTYVFNVIGSGLADLEEKRSKVVNWLSGKILYLTDTAFPGWRFTNARVSAGTEIQYISRNFTVGKLSVQFMAAPYKESTDGVRDQIITLAGKNITAHILKNAVLCTAYTNYGASDMTVSVDGTTMTLTKSIDAQYAGLRCFEIAGEVDFTLTGGYIGSRAITLAGASHGYVDIPSGGGTLTLTAELEEEPSSTPYIIGTFAAGIAFTHDAQKKYRFDDYAVGAHTLTVNGTTKPFAGFTIEGVYDTLAIVGARETDVYKLWYDSVEVSL